MNKQQFMGELKQLLGELPVVEREEALNYYEDYFADAGLENESTVIEQLKSPEAVAQTIKAGLSDIEGFEGEFSETGFSGYTNIPKDEIANSIPDSQKRGFGTSGNNTNVNLILVIIILILLSPVILSVAGTLLGLLIGLLATIFGVLFSIAIAGISLIVAGAILFVVAITQISTAFWASIAILGASLILIGLGGLAVMAGSKIVSKVMPLLIQAGKNCYYKTIGFINSKRRYV